MVSSILKHTWYPLVIVLSSLQVAQTTSSTFHKTWKWRQTHPTFYQIVIYTISKLTGCKFSGFSHRVSECFRICCGFSPAGLWSPSLHEGVSSLLGEEEKASGRSWTQGEHCQAQPGEDEVPGQLAHSLHTIPPHLRAHLASALFRLYLHQEVSTSGAGRFVSQLDSSWQ